MTPSQIKAIYQKKHPDGHFFTPKTMKFFGDTMKNYGCRKFENMTVMYRKPGSPIMVFGRPDKTSFEFFGAWEFNENAPPHQILTGLNNEQKERLWKILTVPRSGYGSKIKRGAIPVLPRETTE